MALILQANDRQNSELMIYTDGSCTGGTTKVGAAAVITSGPEDNPVEVEVYQSKGSHFTCSKA